MSPLRTFPSLRVRPRLEELESRLVPAAVLQGNVLLVTGTARADVIRVEERGATVLVQLNGQLAGAFARASIASVHVDALGGADRIVLATGSGLPTTVDAGSGNDSVSGGAGDDEIEGGAGADVIHGGGGDDVLVGDSGFDMLFGDAGQDSVLGGAGNDVLDGGSGSDALDGGTGSDVVRGGTGSDIVNGGSGINTLIGGPGRDLFLAVQEFEGADPNRLVDFQRGVDRRPRGTTAFTSPFLLGTRTDLLPGAPDVFNRTHVVAPVDYTAMGSTNPPTYGPHHPMPIQPTGVYVTQLDDADIVHNREHGHVVITYDPSKLSATDLAKLDHMVRQFGSKSAVILVPRTKNPAAITISSWAHLTVLNRLDLRYLRTFILTNRGFGPEGYITP